MGLYPINCSACKKQFMWYSSNTDQLCPECRNVVAAKTLEIRGLNTKPSDLVFLLADGTEGLRFCPNGDVIRKGKIIDNDKELTNAMRVFFGLKEKP